MPAFDPVRDAVLNSPIDSPSRSPSFGRRATDLSVLLNDDHADIHPFHRPTASIHALLTDDALATEPFHRASTSTTMSTPEQRPRSSTAPSMTQVVVPKPMPLAYNPTSRRTAPDMVLVPLTLDELQKFKTYRGQGVNRLAAKRKRAPSDDEPDSADMRTSKRHTGDVGVVVQHYNSRPDVGVKQRMGSPIIGLRAFNNWVKSVLFSRFAHPTLQKGTVTLQPNKRGKVLDMGCGKGGDISKWAKSRAAEVLFADIASVSVNQAKSRWEAMKHTPFDASFATLDCFSESIHKAFPPNKLEVPFDIVSMQFCMHYAFETVQKVRCMLDNVTTCLRPGGVFLGTIPNSEVLLEHLDRIPPEVKDKSFGNNVYRITFDHTDERPIYGHRYWFYLQDAVENVPEYIVRWDTFVQVASEYRLHPIYKKEFHEVFTENQDQPEFKQLLVKMGVVDAHGESAMDEDQWDAANIYIAFAFQKR